MNKSVKRLVYASLCLALCLVLPFLTGQIPEIGKRLSPMHIPVFLCGFLCGWPWGLAVGAAAPLVRSLLFSMPALYPDALCMVFELAVYGAVAGWLYRRLPHRPWCVYVSLLAAMVAGRLVWGAVKWLLLGLAGTPFTLEMFLAGAVLQAIPGIILHIALVPVLVLALERAGVSENIPEERR